MSTEPPPPPAGGPPPPPPSVSPPAAWQPGPPTYQRTNGMAVASLVLGVLFCFAVTAILAVIFGYVALNRIDASAGGEKGRGLAIAGIVLGWVGIGLTLALPALVWLGYGISNL
jgi:hypothetical protein